MQAPREIVIDSVVDGRGDPVCDLAGKIAGPGRFDDGNLGMSASGPGGGAGTATDDHGGGGGGHGEAGGAGGIGFGTPELPMLVVGGLNAGSGGGGGAAIESTRSCPCGALLARTRPPAWTTCAENERGAGFTWVGTAGRASAAAIAAVRDRRRRSRRFVSTMAAERMP